MNAALRKRLEAIEARMAATGDGGIRAVFRAVVGDEGVTEADCHGLQSNHGDTLPRQDGETIEALYQRALDASPAGRVTGWRWVMGGAN